MPLHAQGDYKQAYAYYKQGQYDKAIQELKPALDKNPDYEFGHRLAGLCYLNLKNNALAIVELSRAVQLKSEEYITYHALATAYYNSNRLDNCVQSLSQGEKFATDPTSQYSLHHLRGLAYARMQKYDEAIDDLAAAIRIRAGDWTDYTQLGAAYYNLGRYDEAVQALLKALSLKPGDGAITETLGNAYFKQGVAGLSSKNYAQAVEFLRQAAVYMPNNGYVFYNTGEAYIFLKNFPEAEKALMQAQSLLPENADVLQRLGLALEEQKKWSQSLNAYQKAQELKPSPALKEAIARVKEMIKP